MGKRSGKPDGKNKSKQNSTNKWWIPAYMYYCTTKIVWNLWWGLRWGLPWLIDQIFSYIFMLELHLYRYVAGRSPMFLKSEADSLKERIIYLTAANARLSENNRRLEKDLYNKEKEIKRSKNDIQKLDEKLDVKKCETEKLRDKLKTLNDEKCDLEVAKQDAIRRLSEVVSVKLRDNNPNIVDLNDQYRPTKLAEMFSELYDNEWTTAYAVLSVAFTEEHTISILLDIIMETYKFCEERVEEVWGTLTEWFLHGNRPGTNETMKWLKDGRKVNIHKQFSRLGTHFNHKLTKMCDDVKLKELLPDVSLNTYVKKCIEVCLLMVTTDPPVVLVCPSWKATCILQSDDSVINRRDSCNEREPGPLPTKQSRVTQHVDCTGVYKRLGNVERPLFDKELYKEYTCRGKYLDYIVWPSMFLHRDGPLLSKGIAQGTPIHEKLMNND